MKKINKYPKAVKKAIQQYKEGLSHVDYIEKIYAIYHNKQLLFIPWFRIGTPEKLISGLRKEMFQLGWRIRDDLNIDARSSGGIVVDKNDLLTQNVSLSCVRFGNEKPRRSEFFTI